VTRGGERTVEASEHMHVLFVCIYFSENSENWKVGLPLNEAKWTGDVMSWFVKRGLEWIDLTWIRV